MRDKGYQEFVKRLEDVCTQYADKTAITYMRDDGSKTLFSFGEILGRIKDAKEQFAVVGLRSGDRAAIIAPQSPYSLIAALSLAYSNITSVLIDASLPPAEVNRLLEFSDSRAVFTVLETYETLDKTAVANIPVFNLNSESVENSVFDSSVMKVAKDITLDSHLDVIAILFSSGTTDRTKGVMVTYSSTVKILDINIPLIEIDTTLRYLFALPARHRAH